MFNGTIAGNITSQGIETRQAGDHTIYQFSIGTKGPGRDAKKFYTKVELWNRAGEAFAKHHGPGSPCLITGDVVNEEWEDRDGNRRWTLKIANARWSFAPKEWDDNNSNGNSRGGF